MAAGLPEFVDPLSWAESGRRLQGVLRARDMPRLQASLHAPDSRGNIDVDLKAGIDDQGVRFIRGHVRGVLTVTCQRCLQAMELPLESEVALGLVNDHSQADDLPDPYEGLVLETRSIPLKRIVEDELLLALPIVAVHAEGECRSEGTRREAGQEKAPSPFAVLARLKK